MAKKLFVRLSDAVKKRGNGNPRVVGADEHGIDPSETSKSARQVVEILVEGGYEAYIVGGGVRDLMLGLHPKDFDIATDARPEQMKNLFDRFAVQHNQGGDRGIRPGTDRQRREIRQWRHVGRFRLFV